MHIQSLNTADLADISELQPPDWADMLIPLRYYLSHDFCHPIKVMIEGKIVGIGTTILHHDVAWLAHIIVHPQYRNNGLGKIVTTALIESVPSPIETIYLIATELGERVYTKLNFETESEQLFYKKEAHYMKMTAHASIRPLETKHQLDVINLCQQAYGEDRAFRLEEHYQGAFIFEKEEKVLGFYLPSFGDGLIIASDTTAGLELLKLRGLSREYAITMADNIPANELLLAHFGPSFRSAKRMRLGKKRCWDPTMIYHRISGQIG